MKKVTNLLLLALFSAVLTGCLSSYQDSSLMHPQVKTIAIAPIKNQTFKPNLNRYCMLSATPAFQNDGSLKVSKENNADCILYATVTDYKVHGFGTSYRGSQKNGDDEKNYGSTSYKAFVTIQFTVLLPGNEKPLITTRSVMGDARFNGLGDVEVSKRRALKQASDDAVKKMVAAITEAW